MKMPKRILIAVLCCMFTVGLVAEDEMSLEDRLAEARKTIEQEEAKNQELIDQLAEHEEEIAELREKIKELEEKLGE